MLAGPADAVEGNAFLKFGVVILAALAALPVFPAQARATVTESAIEPRHDGNIPVQLGEADRARYRAIFAALHNEQWTEAKNLRSEEHTSELQSLMRISYAVFCLKKKKINKHQTSKQQRNSH